MSFRWVNPHLNSKQNNGKIVTKVTSCTEIQEVTFILVYSYEELYGVNNLNLIKISLSELGASLKNGSNIGVHYFISPCFII